MDHHEFYSSEDLQMIFILLRINQLGIFKITNY